MAPPGGGMFITSLVCDSATTSDVACGSRGTELEVETIIEVNFDMADECHTGVSVEGGPICALPGT